MTRGPSPSTPSSRVINTGSGAQIRVTAKCVCAEHCNNGWMSRLEQAARPYLEPMVFGQAVKLGEEGRRLINLWVAKTAVCSEFSLETTDRVIPSSVHQFIYEHGAPPPNTSVWVGAYSPDQDFRYWHHQSTVRHDGDWARTRPVVGNVYRITFLIGHFVFQFAGFTQELNWKIESPLEAQGISTRLCPITWPLPASLVWPPSGSFDRATLEAFARPGNGELLLSGRTHD